MTEGITGVNIPACQLMIGMGIPLYRIPTLRALYCQDPLSSTGFDMEAQPQRPPDGHLVCRHEFVWGV